MPFGEEKVTKRELMERARRPVPDLVTNGCPDDLIGLVAYFNELRSFTGDYEKPLTMDIVEGWQRHREFRLVKWEREALFAMDRAFRRSVADVIQMGNERDLARQKLKGKGKK